MIESIPEMELSWGQVVRIWWLMKWRMVLGGLALAGLFGFIAGTVGEALSTPYSETMGIIIIGVVVITNIWGVVVLRMALKNRYQHFQIALLPRFYNERPAWLQNSGAGPALQGNIKL